MPLVEVVELVFDNLATLLGTGAALVDREIISVYAADARSG